MQPESVEEPILTSKLRTWTVSNGFVLVILHITVVFWERKHHAQTPSHSSRPHHYHAVQGLYGYMHNSLRHIQLSVTYLYLFPTPPKKKTTLFLKSGQNTVRITARSLFKNANWTNPVGLVCTQVLTHVSKGMKKGEKTNICLKRNKNNRLQWQV